MSYNNPFGDNKSKMKKLEEKITGVKNATDMPDVSEDFIEWFFETMIDEASYNYDLIKERGVEYEYYLAGRRSILLALIKLKQIKNGEV